MNYFDGCGLSQFSDDAFQSGRDCARRIVGSRSDFEDAQRAARLIDEVRESPAGIDTDTQQPFPSSGFFRYGFSQVFMEAATIDTAEIVDKKDAGLYKRLRHRVLPKLETPCVSECCVALW